MLSQGELPLVSVSCLLLRSSIRIPFISPWEHSLVPFVIIEVFVWSFNFFH